MKSCNTFAHLNAIDAMIANNKQKLNKVDLTNVYSEYNTLNKLLWNDWSRKNFKAITV